MMDNSELASLIHQLLQEFQKDQPIEKKEELLNQINQLTIELTQTEE